MRILPLVAAVSLVSIAHAADAPPTKETSPWWGHIKVLASDAFEGRLTGSPGYMKAAQYVAEQFGAAGLKPGGAHGGWYQPVSFIEETVDARRSSAALVDHGKLTPLEVGPDLVFGTRTQQPRSVEAPLVFIGYGLHLPEAGYDDFKGQDLKGKIVVTLGGGPDSLSAALKSHASSAEFPKAFRAAGAVGVIRLQNPKAMDIPWPRVVSNSSQPGMWPAEAALQDYSGKVLSVAFNPAQADKLFARSGHSFAELLALADARKPLPRFAMDVSFKAEVSTKLRTVSSPNVVGVLPGSDPTLRAEHVAVTAHLDHLGVGEPIKGDRVYHGAMDNASGVATLIETARSLHRAGYRPRRTIVFVALTAEEKGLLGSRSYAAHPSPAGARVVADINMDEFLPLFPLKHLLILGEGESSLGALARRVAAERGVDTLPDPAPDRNIFVRSDQYSFIKQGVPSVALKVQGLPGSSEAKLDRDWNTERYHAPQDDLTQPVDVASAHAFNAYVEALVKATADADHRPVWNRDSFFRRFDRTGAATAK